MLPPLYAILDPDVAAARGWEPLDLLGALLDGGARLIQLRAKRLAFGPLLRLADAAMERAASVGATLVVNDRADVARLAGAAGVHVGQDDLPVSAVRRIVGDDALVGLSTHSVAQVDAAMREPASYIAVGPIFGTTTKDTGYRPAGLELVREAARRAGGRPVVAIGGITLETARAVVDAGAQSVAVIGDLFTGGDPAARVRAYLRLLDRRDTRV
ncbi:MAG TPA: thiamine phosphate synthase [Vicinamibacterales bacterium]|nr:thiamine phosphate synthase [Vicinamibacterales bacterium]